MKLLPLKEHGQLLTKQFLLNCHLPRHPGNKFVNQPLPRRKLKPTIMNLKEEVSHLLPISDKKNLRQKMNIIHREVVEDTIQKYPDNKVLNESPPEINQEELSLTRKSRSQLSQLRSGYSRILNSYNSRIDGNILNSCPKCHQSPHDSSHLFNCPANPTTLTPKDLWKQPKKCADFLHLIESIT